MVSSGAADGHISIRCTLNTGQNCWATMPRRNGLARTGGPGAFRGRRSRHSRQGSEDSYRFPHMPPAPKVRRIDPDGGHREHSAVAAAGSAHERSAAGALVTVVNTVRHGSPRAYAAA